ncbi:hypothetical protein ZWY2020_030130 [Hordeum vulgare]|nr:hypothetical protein ZWY2020_030130 [Hordeum vulgare]
MASPTAGSTGRHGKSKGKGKGKGVMVNTQIEAVVMPGRHGRQKAGSQGEGKGKGKGKKGPLPPAKNMMSEEDVMYILSWEKREPYSRKNNKAAGFFNRLNDELFEYQQEIRDEFEEKGYVEIPDNFEEDNKRINLEAYRIAYLKKGFGRWGTAAAASATPTPVAVPTTPAQSPPVPGTPAPIATPVAPAKPPPTVASVKPPPVVAPVSAPPPVVTPPPVSPLPEGASSRDATTGNRASTRDDAPAGGRTAEAPVVLPPVVTPPPVAEALAVLPPAKSKNKHKRKRSGKKKSPAPAPEPLSPPPPIVPEPNSRKNDKAAGFFNRLNGELFEYQKEIRDEFEEKGYVEIPDNFEEDNKRINREAYRIAYLKVFGTEPPAL